MEENQNITLGMIVRKHNTVDTFGEDPQYKVQLRSGDKKTTLNLELPDMGRAVFAEFPKGRVFEIIIKSPSQVTLDKFHDEAEEDEEDD